jgi:hypothetical protein
MAEKSNRKDARRRTYSYVFIIVSLVHNIPVVQLGESLRYKAECRRVLLPMRSLGIFTAMILPATL